MLGTMNTWVIGEVLDRIVGQLGEQVGIDHQRGIAAHQQGVAVGRRLGDALDRDVAAGPGDVLDHDRLTPGLGELVAKEPRGDVGRHTGREADDDPDRLLGVVRLRERSARRQPQCQRRDDGADRSHNRPPIYDPSS
jgi:hypothetical protein